MAVSPTVLSEINDLAKDYYTNVWEPQQNTTRALKAQFSRLDNFLYTGRKAVFGVKLATGGGASNAGANKTLPDANAGSYDQGEARVIRTYVRAAFDLFLEAITKQQGGSYRPAVAELMSDRMDAIDAEINRQMFSKGDGKLCLIGGTPGANATQTVRLDYAVTNGGNGTRHIVAGDYVAVRQGAGTLIGRREVSSVDTSAQTVTFDSSITTIATTDFITKSTADDDNYTTTEALGLLSAMQTSGTFEAITIGGRWKAKVLSNSGTTRPISDPLVMQTLLSIRAESGEMPNLAVCRDGVVLKYSEVFLPIRRIDGQEKALQGGFEPIAFIQGPGTRIPVLTDIDCPDSRLFFLNTKYIKMIDLVGTEWADRDGAEFSRIPDKDGVEGYVRKYWGLAWTRLNTHGVLEDVEDVASIDAIAA